jgi:hypothetical protein
VQGGDGDRAGTRFCRWADAFARVLRTVAIA